MTVKRTFLALCALLAAAAVPEAFGTPLRPAPADNPYQIVPRPRAVSLREGAPFRPDGATVIAVADSALLAEAELLAGYMASATGLQPVVTTRLPERNYVLLSASLAGHGPEDYALLVDADRAVVNGGSPAGTFYGVQLLRKALFNGGGSLPAAAVADAPRFRYRGTHLDCSRHFFPVDSVKAYIDILAMHNVNRFHWHLSDDQGWRIEIKRYPRLAETGQWRKGTCIADRFGTSDSIPYGGYYTQDEARDIIRYAAQRHITVIPEIDMPGHMLAALQAYPELGCEGGPYETWTRWGVSDEVLCAGNDSVYSFIDGVLEEIAAVFPSELIHIGGDECPKDKWEQCPRCQARIRELGLVTDSVSTAEQKLQNKFMIRASRTLERLGRRLVGWDEIFEGGVDDYPMDAVVMSWRGRWGANMAVTTGREAILTPTQFCYFDYPQTRPVVADEPPYPAYAYLPLEKVYSFEPFHERYSAEEQGRVLGCQANVWTEYIPTLSVAQVKLLPRLAAMCEVQWTPQGTKDYPDFLRRLQGLEALYDHEGLRHCSDPAR